MEQTKLPESNKGRIITPVYLIPIDGAYICKILRRVHLTTIAIAFEKVVVTHVLYKPMAVEHVVSL
jgi:hypothetical protein